MEIWGHKWRINYFAILLIYTTYNLFCTCLNSYVIMYCKAIYVHITNSIVTSCDDYFLSYTDV